MNTNDTKYPIIIVTLAGNGVDFSISASPASGSTIAGYSVTMNLTLTPLGGYAGPIALTCTTNAGGSTCIPQTASPTLSAVTVMPVAITTTSQYTVIGYSGLGMSRHPWITLLSLLGIAVLFYRNRKSRLPRLAVLLIGLGVLSAANMGCGSRNPDANANPTYPGTYTYTVTATDGQLTHTATYTLSVAIRY